MHDALGLVLPKTTQDLVKLNGNQSLFPLRSRQVGLHLDKFTIMNNAKEEDKKNVLNDIIKIDGSNELLQNLSDRRTAFLDTLKACHIDLVTASPLALHLSRNGVWENAGLCLHPVYGFPYIPGSGIKGLVRSWAETRWAPDQENQQEAWKKIDELFGYSVNSESFKYVSEHKNPTGWRPDGIEPELSLTTGRLVFHDAWPKDWPRLIVDITNNHHTNYYSSDNQKSAPGDWEDPVPVYFLCVQSNTTFTFAITDRNPSGDDALEVASSWLIHALSTYGAGAKTNAGFGRFHSPESIKITTPSTLRTKKYQLKLVSPAFLAGANQQREDCELRGSTLRGLLRWWWRTMYAGKIDLQNLKRLENGIWGSIDSGSPICISIHSISGNPIDQYSLNSTFLDNCGISDQRRRTPKKMTMGLYYYTYGMEDKNEKDNRWYMHEHAQWEITFTTRDTYIGSETEKKIRIDANEVERQVSVALWLLCRYGGIGAKSRKGFGSLSDISVDGLESLKDCTRLALDFAAKCGINTKKQELYAPSLDNALFEDFPTEWNFDNPWFACHMIGESVKIATQRLEEKIDRIALGLPRKLEGVNMDEFQYRHASPVLWSLVSLSNGNFAIRFTAFPSPRLPNAEESEEILKEFIDLVKGLIKSRSSKESPKPKGNISHKINADSEHSHSFDDSPSGVQLERLPSIGDIVDAEILSERTKTDKRRAKHVASGWNGPIIDDIPDKDVQGGDEVQLYVQSVHNGNQQIFFQWSAPPRRKSISNKRNHSKSKSNHHTGKRWR